MEITTMTLKEKIKEALDGRSQRWLSLKMPMAETDLSRKISNNQLTQQEIDRINSILNSNITLA